MLQVAVPEPFNGLLAQVGAVPLGGVMVQRTEPVGVGSPVGPIADAVKVRVAPGVAADGDPATDTAGMTLEIMGNGRLGFATTKVRESLVPDPLPKRVMACSPLSVGEDPEHGTASNVGGAVDGSQ
jgi:hypothetical protein